MVHEVVEFLNRLLGQSTPKSKGNHAFHCPWCKHPKKKLEVHPERGDWNCWVCENRKGRSLFTLLKALNCKKEKFDELNQILPKKKRRLPTNQSDEIAEIVSLPKEFKPLWEKHRSFEYTTCINYLYDRGVTLHDIIKYRLGYCERGIYANMIIFPNLDDNGKLNYFTTRSFLRNSKIKFINPPISRDVIGFEFQLNWNLPIVIVESALDAITVRRNATPIYGTIIPKQLKMKLLEHNVDEVYLALDPDAIKKTKAISEYFINVGINTKEIKIPNDSDVNKIGYEKFWNLFDSATHTNYNDIFENKLTEALNI